MTPHIILSWSVTREHPILITEDCPDDVHTQCFMAFLRCAASNPHRVLNLKDDESIFYRDTAQRNQTFTIKLGG